MFHASSVLYLCAGYTDVNLETRIQLLEACWMEVLLIGLVWRSLPYDDVLVFAADLHLDQYVLLISLIPYHCIMYLYKV